MLAFEKRMISLSVWAIDEGFSSSGMIVITESDIFGKKLYSNRKRVTRAKDIITDAISLEVGDAVIHIDHGIGRFQGFETIETNGNLNECLLIEYAEQSKLFLPVENIELLSRHGHGLV